MERVIDRFDKYMKLRRLNDNKVTNQINLSVGLLGKARKEGRDLSKKTIEIILNFYTDIEKKWFLTGEGKMLKSDQEQDKINIPTSQDNRYVPYEFVQALVEERKRHDDAISELLRQNGKLVDHITEGKKMSDAQKDKDVGCADTV